MKTPLDYRDHWTIEINKLSKELDELSEEITDLVKPIDKYLTGSYRSRSIHPQVVVLLFLYKSLKDVQHLSTLREQQYFTILSLPHLQQ